MHQAYLDAPIEPHLVVDGVELAPLSTLPLVDWDNITKDPRLEDLEAFEAHPDTCDCAPCFRALARMSNQPELASSLGAP